MQGRMTDFLADRDEWPLHHYALTPYRNKEAPVVFWGAYEKDLHIIEQHKGQAIIVWRGNDLRATGHRRDLWTREGWELIATSRFHETELTEIKLPYKRRNLPGRDLSAFTYLTAGQKIFFYTGGHENYREELIPEIQAAISDEIIVVNHSDRHTRDQIRGLMSECWLELRLRSFDGIPSTILEMASMGRRSVFNGDIPGSIPWADTEEIVTIIQNADRDADPGLPYALKDWLDLDSSWYE